MKVASSSRQILDMINRGDYFSFCIFVLFRPQAQSSPIPPPHGRGGVFHSWGNPPNDLDEGVHPPTHSRWLPISTLWNKGFQLLLNPKKWFKISDFIESYYDFFNPIFFQFQFAVLRIKGHLWGFCHHYKILPLKKKITRISLLLVTNPYIIDTRVTMTRAITAPILCGLIWSIFHGRGNGRQ